MDWTWTIAILIWTACAVVAWWIATAKRAPNPGTWAAAGLLFGPIGVLGAIAFAKPAPSAPAAGAVVATANPDEARRSAMPAYQCPACSKAISATDAFCPSCGTRLTLGASATLPAGGADVPVRAESGGRRGGLILGVVVIVGLVLAGGAYYLSTLGNTGILAAQTMTGTFTLTDTNVELGGGQCEGTGGYADIRDGLGVTIKDQTGKIIGTTGLRTDTVNSRGGVCVFTWSVADVPRVDFYTITVGKRGDLTYPWAEMVARLWQVDATLGS